MDAPFDLILCDRNPDVVAAWRHYFELKNPEVRLVEGDLFEVEADAIAVPGNAFGFLDRGLELQVCERFGWATQDLIRANIRENFFGELLVGQALTLPLSTITAEEKAATAPKTKALIYGCLYRTPVAIEDSVAAYLCARGIFQAFKSCQEQGLRSLALPGIGTGKAGGLHPFIATRQTRYAFQIASGSRGFGDKNLSQLTRRERKLSSLPKAALEDAGLDNTGNSGADASDA